MTYKELNDRLSKCESTLEKIKNGAYKTTPTTDLEETTIKLTLLRESLQKQIAESEETMFVTDKTGDTKVVKMDRKTAMGLKSDPNITGIDTTKGQEIKEDIKFSIDETKSIAKKVGKAVALALKEAGDEIGTMKAKRIEPNSFEIYVEYKKDIATDEFSFYITDDRLHLTDFSFDKELVDVGVKPSGEALVNVDVLKNELIKHFSTMRENIKEAPDNMYYIKISKDAASQNKAQVIFNDIYDIDYEINDDPDGIIMYFKKEDYDPGLLDDLEGDMVQILDTNIPMSEEKEMIKKEDMDVGHEDDEPDMLQSTAFETAQYAAKLVKKLQKYDNFDGEVDFPNWWQSKLILAKDYMQKAYHYLDSEEKQPAIDQLALEGDGMTTKIKPSEGDPTNMAYTDKVNEESDLEEFEREYLSTEYGDSLADDFPNTKKYSIESLHASFQALHKKSGHDFEEFFELVDNGKIKRHSASKLLKLKAENENVNEVDGDRFVRAAFEDLEQVIRNLAHTAEISEDEALEMAIRKLEAMLDGRDDIEEGRNVDDLYDTTIHTMKRLAKKYKAGDKSVVPHLKKLTDIKKKLEQEKIKKASNIGKGQELDEGRGDGDAINDIIINMANEDDISTREAAEEIIDHITHIFINTKGVEEAELDKKEKSQVKKIVKQLKKSVKGHGNQAKYLDKLSKESAPGYKHDCAAKVVHEKYGEGNTIPEKHTLVKEGNKYVVTHYDVLFENGKTVTDIPVSELDVKTSNEHWHKGYKKKKK